MNWEMFLKAVCDNSIDDEDIEYFYMEFYNNPNGTVREIFNIYISSEDSTFVLEALERLRFIAPVFENLYDMCIKPFSAIGGITV